MMAIKAQPIELAQYLKDKATSSGTLPPELKSIEPQLPAATAGASNPYLESKPLTPASAASSIREWSDLIKSIGELVNSEPIKAIISRAAGVQPAQQPAASTNDEMMAMPYSPPPQSSAAIPHSVASAGATNPAAAEAPKVSHLNTLNVYSLDAWELIQSFKGFLELITNNDADVKVSDIIPYFESQKYMEPLHQSLIAALHQDIEQKKEMVPEEKTENKESDADANKE